MTGFNSFSFLLIVATIGFKIHTEIALLLKIAFEKPYKIYALELV